MNRVEGVLNLSIYGLTAYSAYMLTTAEGLANGWPPEMFTIPLALVAYLVVERWRRFALPVIAANLLGLAAVVLAGVQMFNAVTSENQEAALLALAHFLVYLNWVVLWQRKTVRHYWSLCALCVGQVAVGSVLTDAESYGLMLAGFLFAVVWTLTVFSLYQSQREFDAVAEALGQADAPRPAPHTANAAHAANGSAAAVTTSAASRLVGPLRRPSTAVGAVQRDPRSSWINRRFAAGNLGMSSVALVLSVVLFLLIPRHRAIWGAGRMRPDDDRGPSYMATTGFARQVRLGEMGQILESTQRVMEVQTLDAESGEERSLLEFTQALGYDEPYFRGSVMMDYDRDRPGEWRVKSWENAAREPLSVGQWNAQGGVRQVYTLEPDDNRVLFAIPPVVGGRVYGPEETVMRNIITRVLRPRAVPGRGQRLQYEVYSPAPGGRSGRSRDLARWGRELFPGLTDRNAKEGSPYFGIPPRLGALVELARKVSGMNEPVPPPEAERAQRLVTYLRDSGEFGYTLNIRPVDPARDPIEDFLFNRKAGHCEYFASALTLMLRAADVPSRLVSGFKGVEQNRFSGRYEVQGRHAHAWVEAYIDGRWQLLDPTPADARSEVVSQVGVRLGVWSQIQLALRDAWSKYVIKLDELQQRTLLAPVKDFAIALGRWIRDGRTRVVDTLKGAGAVLATPERWFSWEGGAVTFVLLSGLLGVFLVGRRIYRSLLAEYRERQRLLGHAERQIQFYERFRRVCLRLGLRRRPTQTQREFAASVARTLSERTTTERTATADGVDLIADAFYRVRFGRHDLDAAALAEIDRRLTALETVAASQTGPA
jgi:transglutaminase-like putative cysteine protease